MGMLITGSDLHESRAVEHLRSLGIPVSIGHSAANIGSAELIIRTAAVHDETQKSRPPRARHPVLSGLRPGVLYAGVPKRPVHFRHPRKNHHDLHVYPYLHGGGT